MSPVHIGRNIQQTIFVLFGYSLPKMRRLHVLNLVAHNVAADGRLPLRVVASQVVQTSHSLHYSRRRYYPRRVVHFYQPRLDSLNTRYRVDAKVLLLNLEVYGGPPKRAFLPHEGPDKHIEHRPSTTGVACKQSTDLLDGLITTE